MRYVKYAALIGILALLVGATAGTAGAQVRFGVGIGVDPGYAAPAYPAYGAEPACPYGYYPYAPYACAPYGYWGPQYFVDGIFLGAGPWFRGWGWRPGPGFYGRGYYGRPGLGYRGGPAFRGPSVRGPVGGFHGNVGGGFRGNSGGFHGGGSFHGGGGFHGGGRRQAQ